MLSYPIDTVNPKIIFFSTFPRGLKEKLFDAVRVGHSSPNGFTEGVREEVESLSKFQGIVTFGETLVRLAGFVKVFRKE